MNKIIGLLTAWGAESWIRPALKQALEYCDEVMIVVAGHSPEIKGFEDNTYNICKEYPDAKLLDFEPTETSCFRKKSEGFNHMLRNSRLHAVGNWLWVLDVDEFYTESAFKAIKVAIESNEYNRIKMEERFFLINMQHYLEGSHYRLIRVEDTRDTFVITNQWSGKAKETYILPRENGMFHYSMLVNPKMQCAQWKVEYPEAYKVNGPRWIDEIYLNYELGNEDYWTEQNLKLFGIKSPWLNEAMTPDKDGRLFTYKGEHPRFIEEIGYPKIKDFRRLYK